MGEMRDAAIGRRGRGMHIVAKCGDGIVDRLGVVLLQSLQQRGDIVVEVAAVRVVVVGCSFASTLPDVVVLASAM